MRIIKTLPLAFLLLAGVAEAREFTVLYTSDIHDHVRPGPQATGGLPSIATYVESVRAENPDAVLVDAGDTAEKGDLVAYHSESIISFELMKSIGYNVIAVGNHEQNAGLPHVRKFNDAAGGILTSVNLMDEAGKRLFPAHHVIERDGIRIGIIGASLPSHLTALNIDQTADLIAREAREVRTRERTDVNIVLIHAGLNDVRKLAAKEPDVDFFIAGHSHENIETPVTLNKRGAKAVQAAHYANFVGRMDVAWDGAKWSLKNTIVPMRHNIYPPHAAYLARVKAAEAKLPVDPSTRLTRISAGLGFVDIARIASESLRLHYKADIAFLHPTYIVRDILYPGDLVFNDVFKTMSDRGERLVRVRLTKGDIETYVNGLHTRYSEESGRYGWNPTLWSGFAVTLKGDKVGAALDPAKTYDVVMAKLEWENRYTKLMKERNRPIPEAIPVKGGTFEAILAYVKTNESRGSTLEAELKRLKTQTGTYNFPKMEEANARTLSENLLTP